MTYWGKVVGALIGFAIFKLPGGILGLIVGHMFDVNYARSFSSSGGFARFFTSPDGIRQDAMFFHALFSALGHISKADGRVTPEEIKIASILMDDMQLTGQVRQEAQQAFRDGKERDFPLDDMVDTFKAYCHGRSDIMQIFLEILIAAACADGKLSQPELNILQRVASRLGFSNADLQFLITTFEAGQRFRRAGAAGGQWSNQRQRQQYQQKNGPTIEDAYKILGVAPSVDDKEVKRAYKKQMSQHHPDKLLAKGVPQQAIDLANRRTQEIQAAYELIKQNRGF
ncbi:co-chaperone DjlA [Glaciecola sp. 1036]|uniref:co-chaperone DjlA n=1 Tax=Alteromonadaceae TaxID=72275 RepID=UPI003D0456FD